MLLHRNRTMWFIQDRPESESTLKYWLRSRSRLRWKQYRLRSPGEGKDPSDSVSWNILNNGYWVRQIWCAPLQQMRMEAIRSHRGVGIQVRENVSDIFPSEDNVAKLGITSLMGDRVGRYSSCENTCKGFCEWVAIILGSSVVRPVDSVRVPTEGRYCFLCLR